MRRGEARRVRARWRRTFQAWRRIHTVSILRRRRSRQPQLGSALLSLVHWHHKSEVNVFTQTLQALEMSGYDHENWNPNYSSDEDDSYEEDESSDD
jgi:hypothetical protein